MITFPHPEFPEPKEFESAEAAKAWAAEELSFWHGIQANGLPAVQDYLGVAQRTLSRVSNLPEPVEDNALADALHDVRTRLSLFSDGERGSVFSVMLKLDVAPRAISFALEYILNPAQAKNYLTHGNWTFDVIVALSYVTAFETSGDSQRLIEFLTKVDATTNEIAETLTSFEARNEQAKERHDGLMAQLEEALKSTQKAANATAAKFDEETAHIKETFASDLSDIRKKFEEQFALRTPMSYWNEKGGRHAASAKRYQWAFTGLLIGGVVGLSVAARMWLFPFLTVHPTAYWALILFSVAIAIWAWPLRIASRLYLTHTQLFEDAAEREVIARTFLALGEVVQLSDADRQLLLAALLRQANIALVSEDSGLNVADIVLAKTLTKT
jgi:hypothetical protein